MIQIHLMVRISSIVAIMLLSSCTNAQKDDLINSSGTFIGSRSAFHSECVNVLAKESSPLYDFDAACTCILEAVLSLNEVRQATSPDFLSRFDFISALLSDPTSRLQLETCMRSSALHDTPIKSLGVDKLQQLENSLVDIMTSVPAVDMPDVNVRALCHCFVQELVTQNLTVSSLLTAQDPNSPLYNEIMVPCVDASRNTPKTNSSTVVQEKEIDGPSGTTEVPITHIQNIHKVKIQIGDLDRYFIIDSGAGDCIVSKSFMNELMQRGLAHSSDQLQPKHYSMADGSQILCDRYRVHGLKVGEYTLQNVIVATIDQNIHFLMGISALDKFASWRIDASRSRLILTK